MSVNIMRRKTPYLYIASSWRNKHYGFALKMARGAAASAGAEGPEFGCYDFRDANGYFKWEQIDSNWENWSTEEYIKAIHHSEAERGWNNDFGAMERATAMLLVAPCGRSAHLELGWAAGRGIPTAIYMPEKQEPELMYRMVNVILTEPHDVIHWVRGLWSS